MIIIKIHCFHVAFLFFFILQIRILSYLSPDCDAAYLDLLRIRLLCTFAYLVDIMNLRNKTHEFEWKLKGSLSHSHSQPWVDPRLDRKGWRNSGFFGIARTPCAAAYFQWYFLCRTIIQISFIPQRVHAPLCLIPSRRYVWQAAGQWFELSSLMTRCFNYNPAVSRLPPPFSEEPHCMTGSKQCLDTSC